MRGASWALAFLALSAGTGWAAGRDDDLDLIPDSLLNPPPTLDAPTPGAPVTGSAEGRRRIFLEGMTRALAWRPPPVPPTGLATPGWTGRLSLDARLEERVSDRLTLTLADRLDLSAADDRAASSKDWRNTLKEAYLTWRPGGSLGGWAAGEGYLDLGRINARQGVALGFNPSDWLRADAVVVRYSDDPASLRENRLGTVMARAQTSWDGGSATLIAAPKLTSATGAYNVSGFNPGFDRTNHQNRFIAKGTLRLGRDLAPELLAYQAGDGSPQFGLNLTRALGDRLVAFAEASAGRQRMLAGAALADAVDRGLLPAMAPPAVREATGTGLAAMAAVGASLTLALNLTVTLEYEYNGAGLTGSQLRDWITAAQRGPLAAGEYWVIRRHVQNQQIPLARHQLFLHANLKDMPWRDLELTGMVRLNPYDASAFFLAEALYPLSSAWSLGLQASTSVGSRLSEWGSLPEKANVQARVARYF